MTPRHGDEGRAGEPALTGFWGGGFEGADHVNARGDALDLAAMHGHTLRLEDDHLRARRVGLSWIRESIGWRLAEPAPGRWDLHRAERIARSAERAGLQVAWTLWHYGLPPDLSLHDDALIPRFAAFAAEVARVVGRASVRAPVFTPINEINYIAWAASQDGAFAAPNNTPGGGGEDSRVSGYVVKRRLVRAALAAMDAMRAVDPRCRFLHVEPIIHVDAPRGRPDLAPLARQIRQWQWQSWDMLAGRADPELGGTPDALDILGVNHYAASQWEAETEERLHWHLREPRRQPFSALLVEAWARYGRPIVVAETGHVGVGRGDWLDDIADEVRRARGQGVPVQGLCLYPLVDRPDWDDPARWHRSGLWHVPRGRPTARVVDRVYAASLAAWRAALPVPPGRTEPPPLLVLAPRPWGPAPHRTRDIAERLAGRWRVVFIEPPEPADDGDAPRLDVVAHGPDRVALRPRPAPAASVEEARRAVVDALRDWWAGEGLAQPLAWVAADAMLPLARALEPRALVVDAACAPASANAPGVARVVRARGPADPRRDWLLPDGVDRDGFVRRLAGSWEADEAAALLAGIAQPRALCHACLDADGAARLEALARRCRWLSIVVAGPVDATLAAEPNLHVLGAQPQRLLPELLAASRFVLSPAPVDAEAPPAWAWQAWAAGRPVVAEGEGAAPGLRLADDAGLAEACAAAAAETAAERRLWQHALRGALASAEWAPRLAELSARLEALR